MLMKPKLTTMSKLSRLNNIITGYPRGYPVILLVRSEEWRLKFAGGEFRID